MAKVFNKIIVHGLRPCAYCGANLTQEWTVGSETGDVSYIVQCNACFTSTGFYPTVATARAAWERRVSTQWRRQPDGVGSYRIVAINFDGSVYGACHVEVYDDNGVLTVRNERLLEIRDGQDVQINSTEKILPVAELCQKYPRLLWLRLPLPPADLIAAVTPESMMTWQRAPSGVGRYQVAGYNGGWDTAMMTVYENDGSLYVQDSPIYRTFDGNVTPCNEIRSWLLSDFLREYSWAKWLKVDTPPAAWIADSTVPVRSPADATPCASEQ